MDEGLSKWPIRKIVEVQEIFEIIEMDGLQAVLDRAEPPSRTCGPAYYCSYREISLIAQLT
jgi:hypothetical protein